MWTARFWARTLEQAISAFAAAALGMLGGESVGVLEADWKAVFSVAAMAAVCSVLHALAGSKVGAGSPESPSLLE